MASLLTLAVYIVLYFIWGAVLSEVTSTTLKQLLLSVMTSTIYAVCLLYFTKLRKSIGENDILEDYKERTYTSLADDCRLMW